MGSNPSQFQGVGGSEMIIGIEAFDESSGFDVECCYGLDRRWTVRPDNDMFIVIGCKVGAGFRDCCQFSLKYYAVIREPV